MRIKTVFDEEFKPYGKVLEGYDYTELFSALSQCPVPDEKISYVPCVKILEQCHIFTEFQHRGFGGMPIQIGYCNGFNERMNCLEYHKSSEFNIAMDDIVLLLGLQMEISKGIYDTAKIKAFHVPAGTGIELYSTTLHYAPCGCKQEQGYRVACVLPRGTNVGKPVLRHKVTPEDEMCFGLNKWLLAHEQSEEARQSRYIGLIGENVIYSAN